MGIAPSGLPAGMAAAGLGSGALAAVARVLSSRALARPAKRAPKDLRLREYASSVRIPTSGPTHAEQLACGVSAAHRKSDVAEKITQPHATAVSSLGALATCQSQYDGARGPRKRLQTGRAMESELVPLFSNSIAWVCRQVLRPNLRSWRGARAGRPQRRRRPRWRPWPGPSTAGPGRCPAGPAGSPWHSPPPTGAPGRPGRRRSWGGPECRWPLPAGPPSWPLPSSSPA